VKVLLFRCRYTLFAVLSRNTFRIALIDRREIERAHRNVKADLNGVRALPALITRAVRISTSSGKRPAEIEVHKVCESAKDPVSM